MFTVSVSKIESFHNLMNGTWGTYESVITDIMGGLRVQKAAFDIGNLVDAYVNDALSGTSTYLQIRTKLGMELHNDGIRAIDKWVEEFKATHSQYTVQEERKKIYKTKHGDLAVTMKIDIGCPDKIKDVKTSKGAMEYSSYLSKIQGSMYLDAFEKELLEYEHFKVSHQTLRVTYQGLTKQMPASPGYIDDVLNRFMDFVVKNDLSIFIDRPDLYDMDTIIFSPKHFYKTIEMVVKDDPGYVTWMQSKGYPLSEKVIETIKNLNILNHGKEKEK